jgi:hypothetical protein
VVTTSEVSVSVTVDTHPPAEGIPDSLHNFAEASCERKWRSSARSARTCGPIRRLRAGGTRRPHPLRLVSQAASRRNITFVLRDSDVPHAMMRLHETFF